MTIVQVRRGTTTEWTTANPILASGEMGYDTTTNQVKMGNGSTSWTMLTPLASQTDVDLANSDSYKAYVQADPITAYPIGITQFLGDGAGVGLWRPWPGVGTIFASITTIRDKTYTGGSWQIATHYTDDTVPPAYRIWETNASDWGRWYTFASQDYVDNRAPLSVKDYAAVGDNSTNNNTALTNAVSDAIAKNRELYWPDGTYLTTASIANFHQVRHSGPGVIKRGSDSFYVEPHGTETNTLYVSTNSASDTNDGLSSTTPMRTTNKAVDVLPNFGPILDGIWFIKLTAGTYNDRVTVPVGLDSVNPITIQGPIVNHPNVPTAIFKEGYNIGAVAIKCSDVKASFIISNIKFDGYNGTTSSAGVQADACHGETFLVNCHFVDCYWGFSNQSGKGDVKGGIFTRSGYLGDTANTALESTRNGNGGGYRGLMGSRHSLGTQNAGVNTLGPYFYDGVHGVFAQETCTGHVDWCVIEGNDVGVDLNVNSRANVDGTSFARNNFDIRASGNCHVYLSANTKFATGADESNIKIAMQSGSEIVDENTLFTNLQSGYNVVSKIIDTKFLNQTISNTSALAFYTATLAGNIWRVVLNSIDTPRRFNVKIYGELIGTAGTKVIQVRIGTLKAGLTFTASDVGVFEAEATIFLTGQTTQFISIHGYRHIGGAVRLASGNGTNTLVSATDISAEAYVGVATDSIRIDAVDVSWA